MPDILHTPSAEQLVASNAWAFLHWLRATRGIDLPNWTTLQHWSARDPMAFGQALAAFARLPDKPLRLSRHRAEHVDGLGAAPLTRLWPPHALIRPLADVLLHADLRPDDRLLVVGSAVWPWVAALLEGTTVILATATPATLIATAADECATVLVAPAQTLGEAAFQRVRRRPNLGRLRTIIASGGPLSPEGRTRIYTWIKPDLLLLARTGDTLWGNPLEPVYTRPAATPGFFTQPASIPPTP